MKNLIIIGAGGLAREVHDLAYYVHGKEGDLKVKGFLSDSPSNIPSMGYPSVLGKVAEYVPQNGDFFICAIGNVEDRKKTVQIIKSKGGKFMSLIHPTCVIAPSVKIGEGVAIKAFCVLASDVSIGDFTFLQSSVIMGHDVQIGDYCQLNSFSFLAGYAAVGDFCNINAGAKIIQNVKIGEGATVGMGSVVLRKVAPKTTVFGNPAKRLKF